jgi:hypothetical protein
VIINNIEGAPVWKALQKLIQMQMITITILLIILVVKRLVSYFVSAIK